MNEEQIIKASLIAGLITRILCSEPAAGELETLNNWAQEHTDNRLLVEELTDQDKLNQQLIDFQKFKAAIKLEKIKQRLFGG
jgi:hypothetical protein